MKIRIKANTVRYRLSKSEVDALYREGKLEEKTEFPSAQLKYGIESSQQHKLSISFLQNEIRLFVPQLLLREWVTSDLVGIDHSIELPSGESLYVLLEKDFKCIDGDITEDQSDYFENPQFTC